MPLQVSQGRQLSPIYRLRMRLPCREVPTILVCHSTHNLLLLPHAAPGRLPSNQGVILTASLRCTKGREKLLSNSSRHLYQTRLRGGQPDLRLVSQERFPQLRLRVTSSACMSVKSPLLPTRRHLGRKEVILMTREDQWA